MGYAPDKVSSFFLLCFCLLLAACSKEVNYVPPEGSEEMAITHYSYDKLIVDGDLYDFDVVILPNGKVTGWAFDRDTHRISPADLEGYIVPEVTRVIIGAGLNGEGFLDEDARQFLNQLKAKGISTHFLDTIEAVNLFNGSPKENLVTFIHVRY